MHSKAITGTAQRVPLPCGRLTLGGQEDHSFHPSVHPNPTTYPLESNQPSIQIQPPNQQTLQLPIQHSIQWLIIQKTNHPFIHSTHPLIIFKTIHPSAYPSSSKQIIHAPTLPTIYQLIDPCNINLAYTTRQVPC